MIDCIVAALSLITAGRPAPLWDSAVAAIGSRRVAERTPAHTRPNGDANRLGAQRPDGSAVVPALDSLAFLLGDWAAEPGSAGETGAFTFRSDVQGHVIVRSNFARYPASGGRPASRHDDLMVIALDGKAVHADYFDSEGHVIHYLVDSPRPREVVFLSETRPDEPRYRLRYALNAEGTLSGQFDIAAPGHPDTFTPYLTWTARRSR
jgi:hypothetical protein